MDYLSHQSHHFIILQFLTRGLAYSQTIKPVAPNRVTIFTSYNTLNLTSLDFYCFSGKPETVLWYPTLQRGHHTHIIFHCPDIYSFCTITTLVAWILHKVLKISFNLTKLYFEGRKGTVHPILVHSFPFQIYSS